MSNKKSLLLASLAVSLITSGAANAAGDAMARDYVAAPAGVDLAVLYYVHKQSNTYVVDGDKRDADFSSDVLVGRWVHFMELGGMIIDPQIILPVGNLNVNIPGAIDDRRTSMGDAIFLSSFWFVNDDASKTYIAFTPYITAPTGDYDDNHPGTSMGSNRWSYTAELGMSKGFGENTYVDLIASVDFYGRNDDYFGMEQKKETLKTLQAISSYNLSPTLWASAKYSYVTGGEVDLDGVDQDDSIEGHTVVFGLAKQFTPRDNIQAEYIHDVKVDNAFENRGLRLRYVHSF